MHFMAMKYQVQDCLKKSAEVCVVGNEYNSKRQHLCEAIVVKSFKAGSKASLSLYTHKKNSEKISFPGIVNC